MSRRSETTTKVFVGSLPPGTTVEELRQLFTPYGDIAECDVVNRCGFLHLENKNLALKAIDELNNSTFKGTRISVEKGRVKTSNRDGGGGGGGGGGRGGSRNGFGGPMRNRDGFRSAPYSRDGDFERRGPSRSAVDQRGNGYGGGGRNFERGGYDRSGSGMLPLVRAMNDGYNGGGLDRRSYMDERRGYSDGGYMGPGGDRMYPDERSMYPGDRRPIMDDRSSMDQRGFDRRPFMDDRRPMDDRGLMGERRPAALMNDRSGGSVMDDRRRPLMDQQVTGGSGMGAGPMQSVYDRRPQPDIYSRRDGPPKSMGGGGYSDSNRNSSYDNAYPPLQQRGYAGGPGQRRDMPPMRRY